MGKKNKSGIDESVKKIDDIAKIASFFHGILGGDSTEGNICIFVKKYSLQADGGKRFSYIGRISGEDMIDVQEKLLEYSSGLYRLEAHYEKSKARVPGIPEIEMAVGEPMVSPLSLGGTTLGRRNESTSESEPRPLRLTQRNPIDDDPSLKRKEVELKAKKLEVELLQEDQKLERVQGGSMKDDKYLELKMEHMQHDMNNAILQLGSAMKDAIKDLAVQKPQEESKLIPLMMDSNNKMFMMMMENNKQSMMLMLENMKQSGESSKQASDRNLEIMLKMMSDKGNPKDNTFAIMEKTMDMWNRLDERNGKYSSNQGPDLMTSPTPWYEKLIETVMSGLKDIVQSGGLQKLLESGILQKAIQSRVSPQEPTMSADDITSMAERIKNDIISKIRSGEIKLDGLLLNPPEPAVIPKLTPPLINQPVTSNPPATTGVTGTVVAQLDPEELKKQIINAILPVVLAEAELRPNESQWVQQAYDYLPADMLEEFCKAEKAEDLQPALLKYGDLTMLLALQEKLKDEKVMKWFMDCVDKLKEMVAEKEEPEEVIQPPAVDNKPQV